MRPAPPRVVQTTIATNPGPRNRQVSEAIAPSPLLLTVRVSSMWAASAVICSCVPSTAWCVSVYAGAAEGPFVSPDGVSCRHGEPGPTPRLPGETGQSAIGMTSRSIRRALALSATRKS